ncbi:MAG: hypothetical protein QXW98_07800 [Candidatus Caldarchaeum sp.]
MPTMPFGNSSIFPIVFRGWHYDTTTLQKPMSVMSVIRTPDISYKALYNNTVARKQAIQQAKIGFGNGGTFWGSSAYDDSEAAPYAGSMFGLRPYGQGDFAVGWMHARYEYDPSDIKETLQDKVTGYSLAVGVREIKKVTKADAGTGSEEEVVFTFPVYGIHLVNDDTQYEISSDGSKTTRKRVFYGTNSAGIKGWYTLADATGGTGSHTLLSAKHQDTVPASPSNNALIVGNNMSKWQRFDPPSDGKFRVLTIDSSSSQNVSWNTVPVQKSIELAPDGSLQLKNDNANPGKNTYYGYKPGKGHGWYNIS